MTTDTQEELLRRVEEIAIDTGLLGNTHAAQVRRLQRWDELLSIARDLAAHIRAAPVGQPDVYVPGLWSCPKCKLRVLSQTLYTKSGTVGANNEPCECANGCGPMWRVTYKDECRALSDQIEAMLETAKGAPVGQPAAHTMDIDMGTGGTKRVTIVGQPAAPVQPVAEDDPRNYLRQILGIVDARALGGTLWQDAFDSLLRTLPDGPRGEP
jgi:hypothetical protein